MTGRTEWNKWMKFNAGLLLADEQVRQLIEAGFEIFRKNANVRRAIMSLCYCKVLESTLWLWKLRDDRTTSHRCSSWRCGFAQYRFAVGAHRPTSPLVHAIFTNGKLQVQESDRLLLYRVPADGAPEEGTAGGYGTKDAGRGLWLRLKNTRKQFKFSLN